MHVHYSYSRVRTLAFDTFIIYIYFQLYELVFDIKYRNTRWVPLPIIEFGPDQRGNEAGLSARPLSLRGLPLPSLCFPGDW